MKHNPPPANPPTTKVAEDAKPYQSGSCDSIGNVLNLTNTTTTLDPLTTYTIEISVGVPGPNGCVYDVFANYMTSDVEFTTGPN